MAFFVQGYVNIRNSTAADVSASISAFPKRYHRYLPKGSKAYWKCLIHKSGSEEIRLQLIDLKRDVIRGKNPAYYESPVIRISLTEAENNVLLQYKLKWKPSVLFCLLIPLLFSACLCGYSILSGWEPGTILLFCLGALITIGFIYWIYDMHRYDKRVECVLTELLEKNFDLNKSTCPAHPASDKT